MHPSRFLKAFIIFLSISVGTLNAVCAQSTLSSKSKKAILYYQQADNYRVRRQYDQAIVLLQNAIKKDNQFIEAYQRLADIYRTVDELDLAKKYYQKVIDLRPDQIKYADSYLFITEILITLEKYHLAKSNIEKYLSYHIKNKKRKEQAKLLLSKAIYAIEHLNNYTPFNPTSLNTNVNQFMMQYFPTVTADQSTLLYTMRNGNTIYDDEDIMMSIKDKNGEWAASESISPNINSDLNEGTCTISADGRTLVFTSCQGRDGYGSCDLYISYKKGDKWSVGENMGPIINAATWESQPSLSADGRTLYFVSNRDGGLGGRDIWVSTKEEKGWTLPQNLGKNINTPHQEASPFIHPNRKTLYFASDGLPGFGGFDVYFNELDTAKKWSTPINIGYPINRGTDQMSLMITADGSKGFYADSEGDQKTSEIKQFDVPEQLKIKFKSSYVKGMVIDQKTRKPLKSQIQIYDISSNELIGQVISDAISGEYLIVLTEGSKYALYIEKKEYLFKSINFDFQKPNVNQSLIIDIALIPISTGAVTVLNNVFFDHDSYQLSKESLTELDKVATFILENKVSLEIGGYTDNTGRAAYNLLLSENRAKAVYDFLVDKKNIPKNKLSFHGYGQDNINQSGKSQLARRIEFKLL